MPCCMLIPDQDTEISIQQCCQQFFNKRVLLHVFFYFPTFFWSYLLPFRCNDEITSLDCSCTHHMACNSTKHKLLCFSITPQLDILLIHMCWYYCVCASCLHTGLDLALKFWAVSPPKKWINKINKSQKFAKSCMILTKSCQFGIIMPPPFFKLFLYLPPLLLLAFLSFFYIFFSFSYQNGQSGCSLLILAKFLSSSNITCKKTLLFIFYFIFCVFFFFFLFSHQFEHKGCSLLILAKFLPSSTQASQASKQASLISSPYLWKIISLHSWLLHIFFCVES